MSLFGSILGVARNLIGAKKASKASKQAAQIQSQSADKAMKLQNDMYQQSMQYNNDMYQQSREDFAPYQEAGTNALTKLTELTNAPQDIPTDYSYKDFNFQEDPGYQFRLAEGEKALNRAAASRGNYDSGATLKALTRYGSDYASNEYSAAKDRYNTDRNFDYGVFSDIWNRKAANRADQTNNLNNLVSVGSGTAGNLATLNSNIANSNANLNSNLANNNSDLLTGQGNALAAGKIGSANAWQEGLGNAANSIQDYFTLKSLAKPTMAMGRVLAPSAGGR